MKKKRKPSFKKKGVITKQMTFTVKLEDYEFYHKLREEGMTAVYLSNCMFEMLREKYEEYVY